MKNVWILNHYAQEPGGAGGTRHYHLAKSLRAYGWKASIIAASVEHQSGRQRLAVAEKSRLDHYNGIPFLWLRTTEYEGNGAARMRNMLEYSLSVLKPGALAALDKPDVIIGSSVHPFAAAAGAILGWRHKVPFVFEVRDLWPQTLIDMGRLRDKSLTARALRVLEKWLYKRAKRIVVLLPKASEYITPMGIDAEKVVWIPNGVDLEDFPKPAERPVSEKFTVMYFGAHGPANGLDNVLKAQKLLETDPATAHVSLRIIGNGPCKNDLIALAEQLGLQKVSFENAVPKREIPGLAAEADAFVFNLIDAPVFKFGISSNKLFDFMAGARPILFCCDAGNNPVEDAGAGLTVSPGNPEALAEATREVIAMSREKRLAMGEAGRRYVETQHGFDKLAGSLADCLNVCCERR
ncbi:glycosyltransferase family 4 protein [Pseudomonas auratipiscis]|uniref:Glycosyltransferase family 4 protein n=1 Tax=Pseudomonas auratipiscis TaxID=3115853 RepID=A0AB35WUQ1_9PSED|nr:MULTISPECIES: glycosyltransferase family 4 protein [unclassified Pseudomonas]MEE1867164.1 glycosyltransferase family 4 protein [Pseudomonas sp. 120P]MEE1957991.1 glycosyltransferase family 4 protein [Pseudomonas sp. 119P]